MTRRHRSKEERDEFRRRVERLAYEALRRSGELVPITPEDVARIEALDDVDALPPSLLTPPDLASTSATPPIREPSPIDPATQRNMARAAREGKAIPETIEERMRIDRELAEGDDED